MAAEALTRGAFPRIQWGPVIAGAFCALAAHIVLGLFGAAFGFAAAPADSKGLGIGAGIWGLLTPFVASLIGAWVAVRVAGERHEASAMVHGALVWCIGLIAGAIFLSTALGNAALSAGSAASGNVGARTVERRDTPANRSRAEARAEDASKGAAAGAGAAGVASLLGLAGAALGATMGRRQTMGQSLRPSTGRMLHRGTREKTIQHEYPASDRPAESGVAYTDERGTVTTRPPGSVERTDDQGLHH
jgi:hypothetical protein